MRVTIKNGEAEVTVETDMVLHDPQALQDMALAAVRIYNGLEDEQGDESS